MDDWQILVNLSAALGVPFPYTHAAHVRAEIAAQLPNIAELSGITSLTFAPPMSAHHWLQTSNPSERWKWDFLYQDLPPTKFAGEPFSTNFGNVIPLREVK